MIDIAFPSSNRLGIPDLDTTMAPKGVPLPVRQWGSTSRATMNPGTWHAYTDDYRFSRLERHPCNLKATGCLAAVEINYSVFDDTPLAVAFWTIYKKRYIARLWQQVNIEVFVDCNLPERILNTKESRYGVPANYPAFATRGYERRLESLTAEYQWACSFGVKTPLFLVIGGGKKVAEWCLRTPGAFHSGYAATKRPHSTANASEYKGNPCNLFSVGERS